MLSLLANRIILNLRGVLLKTDSEDGLPNVELTKMTTITSVKRLTIRRSMPPTPHRGFFRRSHIDSDVLADIDDWNEAETNYAASIKGDTI